MRSASSRRLLGTAAVLLLLAAGGPACQRSTSDHAAQAPGHARAVDTSTSRPTYFAQFGLDTHAYKPRRLNPSVDGSLYVARMRWTTWNDRRAVGTGVAHVNDCNPDCADGHYTTHRVTVHLARPRERCGSRFFTTISVRGQGYRTFAHRPGVACR